ncbi:cation diffusion facilitator family transporter [Candidatus Liberibacter asiaticus]|uniref:Cation efflux protein n=2 Tax=Liberibacter asiaticus TaxID=34021 RepID=A0ABM5NEF7_LIBAS|nr:cation diffusion facilitator family transporter [Candidatus Liberibacter asiaticus]ACT56816.1 probable cation efflux protein [Candidatus Liberibacter asiaticus str. psy62]AGH16583.1 putative cation efflux protein [Candidatus Liberibacter asiaticus str. gxpsy]ALK06974.1 cation diffusion facilitator family transporter [Candidatus Liberibacter asiaticus]ASK52444.1 cation-efflux pump [Candidatus Liberibacter asiaticus]AWL13771.1 cation transporter [Candidatus Liberibacter asiaticus]
MKVDDQNNMIRMALWGIPISAAITALKIIAWYVTGFISLLSDGLESIVNIITAIISYFTLKYAYRPADNTHPFGHQKAEYIAAVVEGLLMTNIALIILYESWHNMSHSPSNDFSIMGLFIGFMANIISLFWGKWLIYSGEKNHSAAFKANGQHFVADVVMSAGVLCGLLLVLITEYTVLDSIIACFMACNILYQGCKVISSSIKNLMDAAVKPEHLEKIKNIIALNASGSIGIHDLKIRQAGATFFINFHLVVDSHMIVLDAHKICNKLERSLEENIGQAIITIHIEPANEVTHGIHVPLKENKNQCLKSL